MDVVVPFRLFVEDVTLFGVSRTNVDFVHFQLELVFEERFLTDRVLREIMKKSQETMIETFISSMLMMMMMPSMSAC